MKSWILRTALAACGAAALVACRGGAEKQAPAAAEVAPSAPTTTTTASAAIPAPPALEPTNAAPGGRAPLPLSRWPEQVFGFANDADLASFQRTCLARGGSLEGAHKIQCTLPSRDGELEASIGRGACPDDGTSLCEYNVSPQGSSADADSYLAFREQLRRQFGEPTLTEPEHEPVAPRCRRGQSDTPHNDTWRFEDGGRRRSVLLSARCVEHSKAQPPALEWLVVYDYPPAAAH